MTTHRIQALRVLTFVMILMSVLVGRASAQTECPATDNSVAREKLTFFLTHPQFSSERELHSISSDGASRIRAVTDHMPEGWICNNLRNQITAAEYLTAPWIYTVYVVDNRYYVVFVKGPIESTRVRIENGVLKGESYWAPFAVYDNMGWPLIDVLL